MTLPRRIKFTPRQGWREAWVRKHQQRQDHLHQLMPLFYASREAAQTYGDDINDADHEVMLLPQQQEISAPLITKSPPQSDTEENA